MKGNLTGQIKVSISSPMSDGPRGGSWDEKVSEKQPGCNVNHQTFVLNSLLFSVLASAWSGHPVLACAGKPPLFLTVSPGAVVVVCGLWLRLVRCSISITGIGHFHTTSPQDIPLCIGCMVENGITTFTTRQLQPTRAAKAEAEVTSAPTKPWLL